MCFGTCNICGVGADLELVGGEWVCENCEDQLRDDLCELDADIHHDERPDENQSTTQGGE